MSIRNIELASDSTVTITGGTPKAFVTDAVTIQNGVHLVCPEEGFTERRQLTFKVRNASIDVKTGTYGKDKKSIVLALPMQLGTGRIVYNTIRIEREIHPELGQTEAIGLNKVGAAILSDSALDDFLNVGSID